MQPPLPPAGADIAPNNIRAVPQPHPVAYLVAVTKASGVADAQKRGWNQLAAWRFATPERTDVRVIDSIRECIPTPGGTRLYKGVDYDKMDSKKREEFDEFVASGKAAWLS